LKSKLTFTTRSFYIIAIIMHKYMQSDKDIWLLKGKYQSETRLRHIHINYAKLNLPFVIKRLVTMSQWWQVIIILICWPSNLVLVSTLQKDQFSFLANILHHNIILFLLFGSNTLTFSKTKQVLLKSLFCFNITLLVFCNIFPKYSLSWK